VTRITPAEVRELASINAIHIMSNEWLRRLATQMEADEARAMGKVLVPVRVIDKRSVGNGYQAAIVKGSGQWVWDGVGETDYEAIEDLQRTIDEEAKT
jgi:hypothetical protein